MPSNNQTDTDRLDRIVAEARRNREQREEGYRERALKLYPWICGRCGREFSGKKARELTVHHKDHDHNNNPPDGSNWELLCIYCHDNEHARNQVSDWYETERPEMGKKVSTTHQPFASLGELLKDRK